MYHVTVFFRYFKTSSPRVVAVVNAIDHDSGENGRISYKISGNASTFLQISDRGVIKVKGPPNSYNQQYHLNITAVDNGKIPLKNSSIVAVTFENLSNVTIKHPIQFVQQEIEMFVVENCTNGTLVGSVAGFVNHTGYDVIFVLLDISAVFSINCSTGKIFSHGIIDREVKDTYDLVVKVTANIIGAGSTIPSSDLAVVSFKLYGDVIYFLLICDLIILFIKVYNHVISFIKVKSESSNNHHEKDRKNVKKKEHTHL